MRKIVFIFLTVIVVLGFLAGIVFKAVNIKGNGVILGIAVLLLVLGFVLKTQKN